MKIIDPSYEIITSLPNDKTEFLKYLEKCGRVCYKSEDRITDTSAVDFIRGLIKSGHDSILEHVSITVKFHISRATSHQLVRHRMASHAQSSQRFCNYANGKFGKEITFVKPACFMNLFKKTPAYECWEECMSNAEKAYLYLINMGYKPQDAREVLPNSTATENIITANIREWRHIFKLRIAKNADAAIRYIMSKLCRELKEKIAVVFDDIEVMDEEYSNIPYPDHCSSKDWKISNYK